MTFFSAQMPAQIKGIIYDMEGNPLQGASVRWLNTKSGALSDNNGKFQINQHEKATKLVFSFSGFNNDTIDVDNPKQEMQIFLDGGIELDEINVQGTQRALQTSRVTIVQTQHLTADELKKAACCNLSESFNTNPSVDVAYSDAATGSKQIKLLGLSGNYVQTLTENIPAVRGLGAAYGLNYIPGPWMESISLSKGTSSVINGYEAITGQINVEFKKPQDSEKLNLNLFLSDAGRIEGNVTSAIKINKNLSAGILAHVSNETTEHDANDDNFLDIPKTKQYNIFNRWYYQKGNYRGQIGIKALYEDRVSGQVKNFSENPYKIGIKTNRYEFFLKNGYILDSEKDRSIGLIVSGSEHEQDSYFGIRQYDGEQTNLYANLLYQTSFENHHQLVAGASFNADLYNEFWLSDVISGNNFKRDEYVPGIFGEYTLNFRHKIQVLFGLRGDYHNQYGFFATPRLHFKYNVSDYFQIRASAGRGYRTPNILAENNYLLASNRKIINVELLNDLKQEKAWNYGLNLTAYIPIGWRNLTLNAEWYYTDFQEQVVVDMDTNPNAVSFYNLNGKSYSSSIQLEASTEIIERWTMTLAYRYTDVRTTINGTLREKPLTSRYKAMLTTSYSPSHKWQFDFTAQLNGGGRMPDPDPVNPLWEKEFKPYVLLQCQITKKFKLWSVYAGSENLTNFVQKNPIISANNILSQNFDASMVWGPVHGRKFYLGLRLSL
jgi:outer membrane receptor for ferrienterochelin and colicin